jgi:nickel-dependent lactate racemase
LVYIGKTPEGADIFASANALDADVRIGIGNLAPHPVMGWGGGGKILYPGVTGEDTVSYFHLKASLYDGIVFGRDTTPIRDMMEGWVDSIGLDFIINTILTPDFQLFKAVAGHYVKAHREGVKIAKEALGCQVNEKVDVAVVSSHPADQDFWQSPKGMFGAEAALKGNRGGTIVLVSPNYEGVGNHHEFLEWINRDDGDDFVNAILAGKRHDGDALAMAVGNGMSKLRRRRKLVVVSDGVTATEMERCGILHYPLARLQEAVDDAVREYPHCRLAAISSGAETFLF